jgi:hypothetical protein
LKPRHRRTPGYGGDGERRESGSDRSSLEGSVTQGSIDRPKMWRSGA